MKRRTSRTRYTWIAAVCAAWALAAASTASAQLARGPAAESDDITVTVAGQRIAIDPKTGRMRQPTPAEAREISEQLQRMYLPVEPPVAQLRADGSLMAELPEEMMEVMIYTVNPDGTPGLHCVSGMHNAVKAISEADAARTAAVTEQLPRILTKAQLLAAKRTGYVALERMVGKGGER